jgi:arginase
VIVQTARDIEILGVPMDLGQDRRGVDMGPSAIRYARLRRSLRDLGHRVTDLGNVEVPIPEVVEEDEKARHLSAIVGICTELARSTAETVSRGAFPLVLGGDHSISIGTVSGVARSGRTGVIWVDAHADFNTPETSPSGNIHGMPLAVLTGLGHPELVGIGGEGGSVRPEDVVLLGVRSIDPEERDLLLEAGVHVYTMKEIDAYGAARVVRQAISDLSHLERVHLSFDLDVIDPEIAPGVGTPVRGGLSYREAHLLMELLNESGAITSLDIVEVNPILDVKNETAVLAVEFAASLMGRHIIGVPR